MLRELVMKFYIEKKCSESELIDYINLVKKEIGDIPAGYVDAYYEFSARPNLADSCDVYIS